MVWPGRVRTVATFAPHTFFTDIGPFGVQNDHYLRDTATFNLAFGVSLAIAYKRVSWRTPILFCVALQFALHALNHLLDVGNADPGWVGPFDLATLAIGALLFAGLYRAAARDDEARGVR